MRRRFKVRVNGQVFEVEVEEVGPEPSRGRPAAEVGPEPSWEHPKPDLPSGEETISAPLPGLVVEVRVREGEEVEAGQVLLVLEAMKMENEIPAPRAGRVARVMVKPGEAVNVGDPLVVLEAR